MASSLKHVETVTRVASVHSDRVWWGRVQYHRESHSNHRTGPSWNDMWHDLAGPWNSNMYNLKIKFL